MPVAAIGAWGATAEAGVPIFTSETGQQEPPNSSTPRARRVSKVRIRPSPPSSLSIFEQSRESIKMCACARDSLGGGNSPIEKITNQQPQQLAAFYDVSAIRLLNTASCGRRCRHRLASRTFNWPASVRRRWPNSSEVQLLVS
jgi:hypothetical protein